MNDLDAWRFDLGVVTDRLELGIELFGPYAGWLWAIPAVWAFTAISLWLYVSWQQREIDRKYLAYASRQLPLLSRIARQRAREVVLSRRFDRL